MRTAGIGVVPVSKAAVKAQCRVHRRALIGPFALAEPVQYREYFEAERYFEDFPIARFWCTQCNCSIDTLHPYECNLSTPWFPAAPPALILKADRPLAPASDITAIACSPTGRSTAVAAGLYNAPQEIAIWDTDRAGRGLVLPPHGVIRSIAWSLDEKVLITGRGVLWSQGQGSQGPSIFVWDAVSGRELHRFGDHLFGVRGIALSSDGRTLLASGALGETKAEGSTLDLWDVSTGKLIATLARVELQGALPTLPFFSGVAFSRDGSLAIAACDLYKLPGPRRFDQSPLPAWWNRGVRAWRVSDGQEIDLLPNQSAPVRTIFVAQDNSRLFFAGERFGVWNLTTGSLLWDKINGYDQGFVATSSCDVVARGTGYREDNHGPFIDTAIEVYDGAKGDLISFARHRRPPEAMAFVPGTRSLVAGGQEGELKFWNWPVE